MLFFIILTNNTEKMMPVKDFLLKQNESIFWGLWWHLRNDLKLTHVRHVIQSGSTQQTVVYLNIQQT